MSFPAKDLVLNLPETASAIVASCKYSANLMYKEGVTSVSNGWDGDDGLGQWLQGLFHSEIPEFDQYAHHYVVPSHSKRRGAYLCVIAPGVLC